MTARVTVLFLHVAPLPSPINLLHNDFQRSRGGVSLWILSPPPSLAQLLVSKIKQSFLSINLVSLLAFEGQASQTPLPIIVSLIKSCL